MAGATGSAPVFGPCSAYATWDDVERCGCGGPTVDDVDEQDLFLALATEVVWGLTYGRFAGQCVRSFTPCRPACIALDRCRCPAKARIDLGPVPVWGAFVTLDDVEIEVSIENWRFLVREDGLEWPHCTDGVLVVEVTSGWPIPVMLTMATARLACEYAKQCAGQSCALPPKTRSFSREGLTVEVSDPAAMVAAGSTGVEFVDLILSNPMLKPGGQLVDVANEGNPSTSWP
jgi:hypothetical protein